MGAVPAVVGDRQARHLRDRHRVLLLYTSTWRALGDAAASPTLADDQALLPSASPGLHSGAALVVLLIAAALSVYKPKGLTRYGWRKQQRRSTQPALALMRPGS